MNVRSNPAPRGVVLLSMLLILALLSALAYQMVSRQSLVVAQARYTFTHDQTLSYALGGEAFARQMLYEDWSQTGAGVDNLTEAWAQPLAPFEIDDGLLEVQIRDLNGCFNLNSLAGNDAQQNHVRLKTLLRNLNLPEGIADSWRDWVDADEEISGFGAEDGVYLMYDNAYRTANQLAGHISELKLLKDMQPEYVTLLEDNVCVIPTDSLRLNINTAGSHALAALSPNLAEPQMLTLTEARRSYTDIAEATSEYPELVPAADALTVNSEYFEVRVRAQVGESRVELASLLHRDPNDGMLSLVMRDFGRDFRSRYEADSRVDGFDGARREG
ncbi:MAG: type II secretion system minor pseudopilin GspK [Pseudomonadales bacterium]